MDLLNHNQTVIPVAGEFTETEWTAFKTVKSALNFTFAVTMHINKACFTECS